MAFYQSVWKRLRQGLDVRQHQPAWRAWRGEQPAAPFAVGLTWEQPLLAPLMWHHGAVIILIHLAIELKRAGAAD